MADHERRIPAPRHRVQVMIGKGQGAEAAEALGTTRDLSLSGMFVETGLRPAIGSIQHISLVWGDDTYLTRAEIIRHAVDGIGLSFIEPDAGFLWAVGDIISSGVAGVAGA